MSSLLAHRHELGRTPLLSLAAIVSWIAATRSRTRLRVRSELIDDAILTA